MSVALSYVTDITNYYTESELINIFMIVSCDVYTRGEIITIVSKVYQTILDNPHITHMTDLYNLLAVQSQFNAIILLKMLLYYLIALVKKNI